MRDLSLLLFSSVLALFVLILLMLDGSPLARAEAYSRIVRRMRTDLVGANAPATQRLDGQTVGGYYVDEVVAGTRKIGCYTTDAEGVISLLKCGSGNGCYFKTLPGSDPQQLCVAAAAAVRGRIPCDTQLAFASASSNCSQAYNQNVR